MKKYISILLLSLIVLSLASCGNSTDIVTTTAETTTAQTTTVTTAEYVYTPNLTNIQAALLTKLKQQGNYFDSFPTGLESEDGLFLVDAITSDGGNVDALFSHFLPPPTHKNLRTASNNIAYAAVKLVYEDYTIQCSYKFYNLGTEYSVDALESIASGQASQLIEDDPLFPRLESKLRDEIKDRGLWLPSNMSASEYASYFVFIPLEHWESGDYDLCATLLVDALEDTKIVNVSVAIDPVNKSLICFYSYASKSSEKKLPF